MYRTSIIHVAIARPMQKVYDYLADPANLLSWMPSLGTSLRRVSDNEWIADRTGWQLESPQLRFTPRNEYGVLDCHVTLADGATVTTPVRLVPNGEGCDFIYMLRQYSGQSDAQFASEEEWLRADFLTLKSMLETMFAAH
jgi:hypothetical protein